MTLSDILKVEGNTAFAIALSDIVSARCGMVGFDGLRHAAMRPGAHHPGLHAVSAKPPSIWRNVPPRCRINPTRPLDHHP